MTRFADEDGRASSGWLVQTLIILALFGLLVFEAVAVVVSNVAADDIAREVARAARDAYRVEQSMGQAEASANEVAEPRDAQVLSIEIEDDEMVVEVERQAPTLLVHRIGPLEDLATTSASSRVRLTP